MNELPTAEYPVDFCVVITKLSSKGQISVPTELIHLDGIHPGDSFSITRTQPGNYELTLLKKESDNDLVDWLSSCPEKDFFQAIPSEYTDTL